MSAPYIPSLWFEPLNQSHLNDHSSGPNVFRNRDVIRLVAELWRVVVLVEEHESKIVKGHVAAAQGAGSNKSKACIFGMLPK